MGDGTDLALSAVMDHECDISDYHIGNISEEKTYELGIIDELGVEYNTSRQEHASCKHCGKSNLTWKKTKYNKWWLVDKNDKWHTCPK